MVEIGLVDFGCVKRFDPEFAALYRELSQTSLQGNRNNYSRLSRALRATEYDFSPQIEYRTFKLFYETSQWLGKLYVEEYFDFKANPEFIAAGKK